jgi:hypothetical protein
VRKINRQSDETVFNLIVYTDTQPAQDSIVDIKQPKTLTVIPLHITYCSGTMGGGVHNTELVIYPQFKAKMLNRKERTLVSLYLSLVANSYCYTIQYKGRRVPCVSTAALVPTVPSTLTSNPDLSTGNAVKKAFFSLHLLS